MLTPSREEFEKASTVSAKTRAMIRFLQQTEHKERRERQRDIAARLKALDGSKHAK
jgi:hypothetical protein